MNLITKTAIQIKNRIGEIEGVKLAEDLEKMLNTWHSLPEVICASVGFLAIFRCLV